MFARKDEVVELVGDVWISFTRNGRIAVTLLRMLSREEDEHEFRARRRGKRKVGFRRRTFHQMSSGTMASMFLTLRRGIHWSH